MSAFRAYLQLMRLPAVFTALADIGLGFALTANDQSRPLDLGLLLAASAGLYLAGMVFNDVFDREVDAVERPRRPIPSGRVSGAAAARLGAVLVLIGLAAAAVVGWPSLSVAGLLTACIFAYDGGLKHTLLGPVAMGGCRFLNVVLGASAVADPAVLWGETWRNSPLWVAGGLGLYVAGVTLFARGEAGQSHRRTLLVGQVVVNAGLAVLVAWILTRPAGEQESFAFLVAFAVVLLTVNRRLTVALVTPTPAVVQLAVRMALLSIIMLDAILVCVHTQNAGFGMLIVLLLLPALLLGRWLYVT